ncbi:YkgJ family cysteine cluster protein [Alteromonas aestuariivivens]|uniref:YkgJ family cysteine cluster protein n=1 Tax=Alteromonas aestuariivivens TaxID=1938339 RepID=A0A3D8M9T6_9ALTE|nr:YkgJ family cysteine cluster protein [Alteromonas aestuariivivens]RDV26555.1 YkgJ family cysteine cluster protein [Alteromonas aestuariivivens]
MQRLRDLSSQVESVFTSLANEFGEYQKTTGLSCLDGCGACCNNPDIEVSPLEMLPLALHFFDQGIAESMLDKLAEYSGFACAHYHRNSLDGEKGYCTIYTWRPGICRMFGAAGYSNKHGMPGLSVCKQIKQAMPGKYQNALITISSTPPPSISHGRQRIAQIDPGWGNELLPINDALRQAISKVLTCAYYMDEGEDIFAA